MAAFDMDDPKSIVSPGGVGFDINCGVRLLRTNLFEDDVLPVKVISIYCLRLFRNDPTMLQFQYAMQIIAVHAPVLNNFKQHFSLGAIGAKHV